MDNKGRKDDDIDMTNAEFEAAMAEGQPVTIVQSRAAFLQQMSAQTVLVVVESSTNSGSVNIPLLAVQPEEQIVRFAEPTSRWRSTSY